MARGFLSGVIYGTIIGGVGAAALSLTSDQPELQAQAPMTPPANTQTAEVDTADQSGTTADEPAAMDLASTGVEEDINTNAEMVVEDTDATADPIVEEPTETTMPEAAAPQEDLIAEDSDRSSATDDTDVAEDTGSATTEESPDAGADTADSSDMDTEADRTDASTDIALVTDQPELTDAGGVVDTADSESGDMSEDTDEQTTTDQQDVAVADPEPEVPDVQSEPDVTIQEILDAAAADSRPALVKNAAEFSNPDQNPTMSAVLIDQPGPLPLEQLRNLPFKVTVVINPGTPDARTRAGQVRAAGHEVMLAIDLPTSASSPEVDRLYEAAFEDVPVAIGILNTELRSFGPLRFRARQIAQTLAEQGMGMISPDLGRNNAVQLAEREGVPALLIDRELDRGNEPSSVVRQLLDSMGQTVQSDRTIVVSARMTRRNLEALVDWSETDRPPSLMVAPASWALSNR